MDLIFTSFNLKPPNVHMYNALSITIMGYLKNGQNVWSDLKGNIKTSWEYHVCDMT